MSGQQYNLSTPEFNQVMQGDEIKPLNIVKCKYSFNGNETTYQVVRYNKDMLYVEHSYGIYRSVVINALNEVVSFAPPKSLSTEKFIELNPCKTENIVAEEFVEGTMINVFWDNILNDWNISTRNSVGGDGYFFKTDQGKTFKTMFYEALHKTNLDLHNLNKSYCYSFVLQHPDNRIVVPVKTPSLYLVKVYEIVKENEEWFVKNISLYNIRQQSHWHSTTVKFPEIYKRWDNYSELEEKYASRNTEYNVMGVVITNLETNDRCKFRNPIYEEVRHLRGNQPKLQYHYLTLRKNGKISEYLKYYPESKKEFSKFRDQLHLYTNTLYSNYISCYIKKEKPLSEFNGQFKTHMFNIHKFYINELKAQQKYVTNTVVINYVNALHESQQMHALHYHLKKRFVDTLKSEL